MTDHSRSHPARANTRIATLLRGRRAAIVGRWVDAVRSGGGIPQSASYRALTNDVPVLLDALADALNGDPEPMRAASARHADCRHPWADFTPAQLRREYKLLRRSILSVLEEDGPLPPEARDLIVDQLEDAYGVASDRFDELRHFNDELDKQYLRMLERLFAEGGNVESIAESLDRVLDVVSHGMRAEAAAILVFQGDTLELRLASGVGSTPELGTMYRAAVALSRECLPGERTNERSVRVMSAESLGPEAAEALARLAIRCVIVVPLESGGLPGTLCLGFRALRTLEPIETKLLEVLGERLSAFLTQLHVQQQARTALERARQASADVAAERDAIEAQQRTRDDFAARISHDLRNPLNTAKMGAELLRNGGAKPEQHQSLTAQILRSIDRSDRMIGDLLDTYRLRAGKDLAFTIERYSMNELAKEVIDDMRVSYGDRFVLRAHGPVEGYWSRDGMRRALENLVTNAVKYGSPNAPITINVERANDKMQLSVHNEGPALPADEQERVLRPFERGEGTTGKPGWGIGLTLVRGIVDAHGGTLDIESSPERGTTFTIRNPMDSRPFQRGR